MIVDVVGVENDELVKDGLRWDALQHEVLFQLPEKDTIFLELQVLGKVYTLWVGSEGEQGQRCEFGFLFSWGEVQRWVVVLGVWDWALWRRWALWRQWTLRRQRTLYSQWALWRQLFR